VVAGRTYEMSDARKAMTLEQISDGLITYLETELDNASIGYETPLTPMSGGYETHMYRFRLGGVEGELSRPLALRLYPPHDGPGRAIWESTVQNALADQGYPVARAYLTCTDTSILGGVFFVMALLPGELMMTMPFETIPNLLGKADAALHRIDPGPLARSLGERGFDEGLFRFGSRLEELCDVAGRYPWLGESIDWLLEHRPPEPERLSVCHGDFHPLNILVQDGQVTGVLDWPGFMVADPVLDIANTILLATIPAKHLFSLPEWDKFAGMYLDAYRAHRPLDLECLDYYQARRCVIALLEGVRGHQVWQLPPVVEDLVEGVHSTTGIRVAPPGQR
jgi:aminoglycoside phosphotransferase (APT) family kinase protein